MIWRMRTIRKPLFDVDGKIAATHRLSSREARNSLRMDVSILVTLFDATRCIVWLPRLAVHCHNRHNRRMSPRAEYTPEPRDVSTKGIASVSMRVWRPSYVIVGVGDVRGSTYSP
jgi:hypothetical protein